MRTTEELGTRRATERARDGNSPPKDMRAITLTGAEFVEGRTLTKRNVRKKAVSRTQRRKGTSYGLQRVRQKAVAEKELRFNNLLSHMRPEVLEDSFMELKKKAVPGIDQQSWYDYKIEYKKSISDLYQRVHNGSYRALPVKRAYIKKEDGRMRPLGVTSIEDKIVQHAVVTILSQIYEVDFHGFSYGSRPGRSQHDALDALDVGICRKKISWIVDADIQGFFDNIDHDWMMKFIQKRVSDKRILRLIRKWLKTGWIEDGVRYRQEKGTPQGSVISPLLANIFLHYVLDEWIHEQRKKKYQGEVIVVRYVDDFVVGFQYEKEARMFLHELRQRMNLFNLSLHPDKTRLIEFGRYARSNREARRKRKPETFDFLGFTHSCAVNSKGWFWIRRKTIRKRFRRKLVEVKAELRKRMHLPLREVGQWLRSVVVGFQNYFAVPGNMRSVKEFYTQVMNMWLRMIRRRSHKGKSKWSWERFTRLKDWLIPRVRVVHPFPSQRFDAKYSR